MLVSSIFQLTFIRRLNTSAGRRLRLGSGERQRQIGRRERRQARCDHRGGHQKGMAPFTVAKGGLIYEASIAGGGFTYEAL